MPLAKRRHKRRLFDRAAALQTGDGTPAKPCQILDISDGGARLRLLAGAPDSLPPYFILSLSQAGNVRRKCRIAWRTGTDLGVEFV